MEPLKHRVTVVTDGLIDWANYGDIYILKATGRIFASSDLGARVINQRMPHLPSNIQTYRHADLQTCRHTHMQTCRHADLQTHRLAAQTRISNLSLESALDNLAHALPLFINQGPSIRVPA